MIISTLERPGPSTLLHNYRITQVPRPSALTINELGEEFFTTPAVPSDQTLDVVF